MMAVWLALGHGVAAASPSDSSDPSGASDTSTSGDTTSAAKHPRTPGTSGAGVREPTSTRPSTDDAKTEDAATDAKSALAAPDTGGSAEISTADPVEDTTVAGRKKTKSAGTPRDQAPAEDRATSSATPADDAAPDTETAPAGTTDATAPASTVPTLTTAALAAPAAAPSLRTLVGVRPVTSHSIVTDVLTWVGLRPLPNGLPGPAAPVSAIVQSLWLAVRQSQYTLNNQRPTAEATISGPGPDGVVTGNLNAVDYDDTTLAYTVTAAPQRGSVAIDALGNFTYTPDANKPLQGDKFTITVDDTVGNPFHIHGLLALLGITAPTQVSIVVAAPSPARDDVLAAVDLSALLTRDGVTVTTNDDGTAKVIEGLFTDRVVTNADDAASVLNSLAPALGAAAGFADPAGIVTSKAGIGNAVEHFYRYSETVGGIKVIGSDVILVTDGNGSVTSLFNNYVGLSKSFDVTPDASVDTDAEVRALAGGAYLGAAADREALGSLLAEGTFTNQLVVYTMDGGVPSLAWRVVVRPPDTGDMASSGATYLIHADGADAGDIIVTISNAQDVSVTTVATDYLGAARTITADSTTVWFFKSYSLKDSSRGITTFKTSYPFFGLIGPSLPGTVVKKGWTGWDKSAVSAHANIARVYDFYENVLGRTSFDDSGAPIVISIKYRPAGSLGYANAYWDPTIDQFAFGDTDYLQAAVDVVAHEYTHAVVTSVIGDDSALDHGQSGAMNEAYADIMGSLVEGKTGAGRWTIAEDSGLGAIRNLADPASIVSSGYGRYPATMDDYYNGGGDDGGEHINSTIFSHAAYLMMTSTATQGVSDDTWANVFYHSLERLSVNSVFTDGRAAVLSAALAQGLTLTQRTAIANAFDSVGILGSPASFSIAA